MLLLNWLGFDILQSLLVSRKFNFERIEILKLRLIVIKLEEIRKLQLTKIFLNTYLIILIRLKNTNLKKNLNSVK